MTGLSHRQPELAQNAVTACDLPLPSIAALFPGRVFVGKARPGEGATDGAFSAELAALGRVAPVRRQEFLAGRLALRRAQRAMGVTAFPVLPGRDRAPVWPAGHCGSISHAGDRAIAVLAATGPLAALGLDMEPAEPLPSDLLDEILSAAERDDLKGFTRPDVAARIVFSVKEAVYKAQYPLTRQLFGFDRLRVRLDGACGFQAVFRHGLAGFSAGHAVHGRYLVHSGMIVAGAALAC